MSSTYSDLSCAFPDNIDPNRNLIYQINLMLILICLLFQVEILQQQHL
jgi:hypothetical protein